MNGKHVMQRGLVALLLLGMATGCGGTPAARDEVGPYEASGMEPGVAPIAPGGAEGPTGAAHKPVEGNPDTPSYSGAAPNSSVSDTPPGQAPAAGAVNPAQPSAGGGSSPAQPPQATPAPQPPAAGEPKPPTPAPQPPTIGGLDPSTPTPQPPPAGPSTVVQGGSVPFTRVEYQTQSGVAEQQAMLITDAATWQRYSRAAGAPEVDFTKEAVVAVFLGERSTGGYSVTITQVQFEGNKVIVTAKERRPAPGAMVIQVLTYPADLVKIPKPPPGATVQLNLE